MTDPWYIIGWLLLGGFVLGLAFVVFFYVALGIEIAIERSKQKRFERSENK